MGPNQREIRRRLRVLKHAEKIGNVRMTCRYFGLARSTFYRWKIEYDKHGEAGLGNKSTAALRCGSSMHAITLSLPPHSVQVSMSMAKTRLRGSIPLMGAVGLSVSRRARGRWAGGRGGTWAACRERCGRRPGCRPRSCDVQSSNAGPVVPTGFPRPPRQVTGEVVRDPVARAAARRIGVAARVPLVLPI